MWTKPYTFREGAAIAAGLATTGLVSQLAVGPFDWDILAWPANLIALAALTAAALAMQALRRRVYLFRFMGSPQAAVPAIAAAALLTVVMGLTRQTPAGRAPADPLGLSQMLSFRPFIFVYVWLTAVTALTTLNQWMAISWRRVPSALSHTGLYIVLTCGTLGSADMQRLKMYCETGKPEWRALDAHNNVHELPVAIQLERFTIDEYPPKLFLTDREGRALPHQRPEGLLADSACRGGRLGEWHITIEKRLENAIPAMKTHAGGTAPGNAADYLERTMPGAVCALYVKATRARQTVRGWVTCGSYLFPDRTLRLSDSLTLAMPVREPRRYASEALVFTKSGKHIRARIEVNRPLRVEQWNIYQLSYNEQMGKWSNLSVFELVSDPWLPAVYTGVALLLAGAVGLFMAAGRRKEGAA